MRLETITLNKVINSFELSGATKKSLRAVKPLAPEGHFWALGHENTTAKTAAKTTAKTTAKTAAKTAAKTVRWQREKSCENWARKLPRKLLRIFDFPILRCRKKGSARMLLTMSPARLDFNIFTSVFWEARKCPLGWFRHLWLGGPPTPLVVWVFTFFGNSRLPPPLVVRVLYPLFGISPPLGIGGLAEPWLPMDMEPGRRIPLESS